MTQQEFAALSFNALYDKLRKVIPERLTLELVDQMKALYKRFGQESITRLATNEVVELDDDEDDIAQRFPDGENLNAILEIWAIH